MVACGLGWNQRGQSDGFTIWFRLGVRLRDEYGTYVYRMGPEPDVEVCRTIWCYGDRGVAWVCTACGESVGAERYQPSK